MLAGRYRIVGLLGKGGMGEVYKAEDLKLKQTVALKFLPESIALDGGMLARFHNEVRIARQVAHPNVCRVYDIGEVEGLSFLSMEFIDGEDLSSLLRRIGRLPGDKAVELARQMCAGLAAAHEAGVLHRDLKPANVMIDGRGKARITDFGLAIVSEELRGEEAMAGTPAYMAPEQLTGKEVTQRSDIFALGLVLYELFTGKRVFEAKSIQELISLHEKSTPPTPSSHVKDIDPLAERVILRCLEKDPKARPASAVQVALALPGGDPLQAALAMGETPSPEMVAAAGEKTGLRPAVAVACLTTIVIGLFLSVWVGGKVSLIERMPLDSPEALTRKAREISTRLGYPDQPADSYARFAYDTEYLNYVVMNDPSPTRWNRLQFPAVVFNYCEGPEHLQTVFDLSRPSTTPSLSGMVFMTLDPQGRLMAFGAEPPRANQATGTAVDWTALFHAAGLNPSHFRQAEPQWTPPSAFDVHAAWTGTALDKPSVPLRIEAAAWRGKPVHFRIIYPWTQTTRFEYFRLPAGMPTITAILILVSLIGAALVARSNYRRGKGDQRGALKLSCLIFLFILLTWILASHKSPSSDALASSLLIQLSFALFWAAAVWLWYFAFEPFVRRYWPTSIITWSRVLTGRMRDALVGRDMLIGLMAGVGVFLLINTAEYLYGDRYGIRFQPSARSALGPLHGIHVAVSTAFIEFILAIIGSVYVLFIVFLLRVLLRRQWLAAGVAVLLLMVFNFNMLTSVSLPAKALIIAIPMIIAILVTMRFGLLTITTAFFATGLLTYFPLTLKFSAWYVGIGLMAPLTILALAVWAFYTSLGGQKLFQGSLLED